MQEQSITDQNAAALRLRPVVVAVVAAKLAVFALLMTTANLHVPISAPIEMAAIR